MTADDHRAIGSTPPKILRENPCKTLAETMDDQALHAYVCNEVDAMTEIYLNARDGNTRTVARFRELRDRFLGRDLVYLREIRRLPPEFSGFDEIPTFLLPEETTRGKLYRIDRALNVGLGRCLPIGGEDCGDVGPSES